MKTAVHSLTAATALALAVGASPALAQSQGVSKDEIVIGSIQDLSGPIAGFGKQVRNGMQLRVQEINEQGGVNGRKLRLLMEDSGYDPKRAVLAAQKLVNQEKIFAMIGHIGTAQNIATFPVLFSKNVISFFPLTAAREMYEPLHKLKYGFTSPYYDQVRLAIPDLIKEKGITKVCTLYQDDEFGLEVQRGTEAALKEIGSTLTEKTSFKRGATDFSSQTAKLKSAGCDMVVLGTVIRETVGAIAEARKTGFSPLFLGSSAAYTELIHKLGGKAMDGFYAVMTAQVPYLDDPSEPIRLWAQKYKTQFNEDPGVFSTAGYTLIDNFITVVSKVGPDLNTDSFVKTMETMELPGSTFGSPSMRFSATNHLGSMQSRLSQIQDGRWQVVSGYKD